MLLIMTRRTHTRSGQQTPSPLSASNSDVDNHSKKKVSEKIQFQQNYSFFLFLSFSYLDMHETLLYKRIHSVIIRAIRQINNEIADRRCECFLCHFHF